jgi:hypothetical protein
VKSIRIAIADINIHIKSPYSIISKETGTAYKEFLDRESEEEGAFDVTLQIEPPQNRPVRKGEKIFDSGGNWTLYLEREGYLMEFRPPLSRELFWLARFNRDFSEVKVFCGSQLMIKQGETNSILNPLSYPLDQILLISILARNKGALVHAAGIEVNGKGYIFPGRSGAGKSTISNLFDTLDNMKLLSDDRVIVRNIGDDFIVYGTPWPGEAGIAHNRRASLGGIFFIFHGATNSIRGIEPKTAVERLLPVTSIPWYDKKVIPGMLDFCEDLVSNVPIYELHFKPGSEVVYVLEEFLK